MQLRSEETDQEGEGRKVGLPIDSNPLTCPVRPLRAWLGLAASSFGPIFRAVNRRGNLADNGLTDQSVALVVKCCDRGWQPAAAMADSWRGELSDRHVRTHHL